MNPFSRILRSSDVRLLSDECSSTLTLLVVVVVVVEAVSSGFNSMTLKFPVMLERFLTALATLWLLFRLISSPSNLPLLLLLLLFEAVGFLVGVDGADPLVMLW